MMLRGEIEKADHVVFADTGWEPQNVYDHLDRLRVHLQEAGIPFHYVTAKRTATKVGGRSITGNLRVDAFEDVSGFVSMPLHIINQQGKRGMVKRTCTFDYKVQPILLKLREIAGLKRGERCKEIKIEQILGISYDESQRMRDPAFSWIRNEYPLIDQRITREACLKWCADNGYDQPPRSACIGCPFKSNEEWRHLKEMPAEWADAVDFDRTLRNSKTLLDGVAFLHSSCVPLDEVDLRTNQEKGIWSLFDQECEGMCGI
jgi:hypothetical protein